jgi:CxxC-x17-CxxC domain-containing protein
MSANDSEGLRRNGDSPPAEQELDDLLITCMDCSEPFVWTVGEQVFFRDKSLVNSPKRCKDCKRAKNRRLQAIEAAQVSGKRHHFEIETSCAKCAEPTTIPFYPSQGRPVYCRACYIEMRSIAGNGAGNSA